MSDVVPTPPPPGFYPDQSGQSRWWDGTKWTEHTTYVAPPQGYVPGHKSSSTAYLLLFFLGGFGAHHFYLGNVGRGILFIILWWVGWATTSIGLGVLLLIICVIWIIVDIATIPSSVRVINARLLAR